MQRRPRLIASLAGPSLALLVACGGGSGPSADAGPPPAPGSFGAACATVSDTSTECTSGVCTNTFDQLGHPVCSQKCTVFSGTDPTCPNGSQGQKCNMKGYCKP